MESHQRSAIERHKLELIEAIRLTTVMFLSYLEANVIISPDEREFVEKSFTLAKDQLLKIFTSLQHNDKGWSAIIRYLRWDNKNQLADKLEETANELNAAPQCLPVVRSKLDEFCSLLAEYYQVHYANLVTLWESPDHIKDVWVSLSIDSRSAEIEREKRIDHAELLSELKTTPGRNVALIKGDPGSGKTTLMKKFAYDWAVNYVSSAENSFGLLLAVPLRSVGQFGDFIQMAIDYFLSTISLNVILNFTKVDTKELTRCIRDLRENLLIMVDGLDEFGCHVDSPFKHLYSEPFDTTAPNSRSPSPILPFKLIVTSRPYACNRVNMEFFPLSFTILPLTKDNCEDFIQRYCRTDIGKRKALKYAKEKIELALDVPLILTFMCYLADQTSVDIPKNLTSFYEGFLYQMLRRAKRNEKLIENIEENNWRQSQLAKSIGQLAFESGLCAFEFADGDLLKCSIPNDSFACGFLLHKYDFTQARLKAECPHRSIQEFFAAVYCYHVMLTDNEDVLKQVYDMIIRESSLVGRFFFGICSKEGRFDQMTEWLRPSLLVPFADGFNPTGLINGFGLALADCTSGANTNIAHALYQSVEDVDEFMINSPIQYFSGKSYVELDYFTPSFNIALHLDLLAKDRKGGIFDWFLSCCKTGARFVYIQSTSNSYTAPECVQQLLERFKHIDALFLRCSFYNISRSRINNMFDLVSSLPPVRCLAMTTELTVPSTICSIHISYGAEMRLKLTCFRLHVANDWKNELLSNVIQENLAALTVMEETDWDHIGLMNLRKLKVSVNDPLCQSALVFSLMQLALQEIPTTDAAQQNLYSRYYN